MTRLIVYALAAVLVAAALLACHDSPPPETPVIRPGVVGATCAVNGRVLRPCANGLTCKAVPPSSYDVDGGSPMSNGPEMASGEGGPCGGPAAFYCGANLGCDEETHVHGPELGTCVRALVCSP